MKNSNWKKIYLHCISNKDGILFSFGILSTGWHPENIVNARNFTFHEETTEKEDFISLPLALFIQQLHFFKI